MQEPGERRPAIEHVVHRLCDVVVARELGAFLPHPALEFFGQRHAEPLTDGKTIGWDGKLYGGTEVYRWFKERVSARRAGVVFYNVAPSQRFAQYQELGLRAEGYDVRMEQINLGLSCHHIGTIQSFDATKQTASATVNYRKTFFNLNAESGLYEPVLVDYPMLKDCPVVCLGLRLF